MKRRLQPECAAAFPGTHTYCFPARRQVPGGIRLRPNRAPPQLALEEAGFGRLQRYGPKKIFFAWVPHASATQNYTRGSSGGRLAKTSSYPSAVAQKRARERHLSTAGWKLTVLLFLILHGCHAAAATCSRAQRTSVPFCRCSLNRPIFKHCNDGRNIFECSAVRVTLQLSQIKSLDI